MQCTEFACAFRDNQISLQGISHSDPVSESMATNQLYSLIPAVEAVLKSQGLLECRSTC